MFETAELGRKMPKEAFEAQLPALREELVQLQQDLRSADFPVALVFAGVDGAGKGDTVNLLNAWMDPRWINSHAYAAPSDEERERPEFWRFWRDLPGKGKVGLFLSAWYSQPVLDHVYGNIDLGAFDRCLDRIMAFEQLLTDDGALLLKFWMHLGRKAQKKRLKKLENDPLLSWRVTPTDWRHVELYDRFVACAEHAIKRTSTGYAPWYIVEGMDERYRSFTVATTIRDALRKHLQARTRIVGMPQGEVLQAPEQEVEPEMNLPKEAQQTILQQLDTTLSVPKPSYKLELSKLQAELNALYRHAKAKGISSVLVFEGWDAAGKGGTIRRLTAAMDARDYRVIPIAAPTEEERAHNYLWRFWRQLSRAGRVTIFDRSWYGRVLVERVESFAKESEWRRAYAEINEFEQQLVEFGIVLVKVWLHVTPEEQLRRFKEREEVPYKRWKLTDEDWRNREKWHAYENAVHEMVERTSTSVAPWCLIEGNCKRHARLKVIRTFCGRLRAAGVTAGS